MQIVGWLDAQPEWISGSIVTTVGLAWVLTAPLASGLWWGWYDEDASQLRAVLLLPFVPLIWTYWILLLVTWPPRRAIRWFRKRCPHQAKREHEWKVGPKRHSHSITKDFAISGVCVKTGQLVAFDGDGKVIPATDDGVARVIAVKAGPDPEPGVIQGMLNLAYPSQEADSGWEDPTMPDPDAPYGSELDPMDAPATKRDAEEMNGLLKASGEAYYRLEQRVHELEKQPKIIEDKYLTGDKCYLITPEAMEPPRFGVANETNCTSSGEVDIAKVAEDMRAGFDKIFGPGLCPECGKTGSKKGGIRPHPLDGLPRMYCPDCAHTWDRSAPAPDPAAGQAANFANAYADAVERAETEFDKQHETFEVTGLDAHGKETTETVHVPKRDPRIDPVVGDATEWCGRCRIVTAVRDGVVYYTRTAGPGSESGVEAYSRTLNEWREYNRCAKIIKRDDDK